MSTLQPYKTILKAVACEIEKIKGSRFLAFLEPASDRESAENRLRELRKKYPDATHHCFAYTTGADGQFFQRYSDDGEPAGTAGRPILQVIEGHELKNVLLVVVRYYGGTKLGTGGLVKAYTEAAAEVTALAEILLVEAQSEINLQFEYSLLKTIQQHCEQYKAKTLNQEFAADVQLKIEIRSADREQFILEAVDKTHGQVMIIETE